MSHYIYIEKKENELLLPFTKSRFRNIPISKFPH